MSENSCGRLLLLGSVCLVLASAIGTTEAASTCAGEVASAAVPSGSWQGLAVAVPLEGKGFVPCWCECGAGWKARKACELRNKCASRADDRCSSVTSLALGCTSAGWCFEGPEIPRSLVLGVSVVAADATAFAWVVRRKSPDETSIRTAFSSSCMHSSNEGRFDGSASFTHNADGKKVVSW